MNTQQVLEAQTADEVRGLAIDWQNWQLQENLSYSEHVAWAEVFERVGAKFGIMAELQENGII